MDDWHKNIFDVIFGGLQLLLIMVGGVWAYFRFFREGTHNPRVEFDIDCTFLGPQEGQFVAAFQLTARNRGQVEYRFHRIGLKVLGIKSGTPLLQFKGHEPLLEFPEKVAKVENMIPKEFGYYFVRPGVEQNFSIVVPIPASYSIVLARATFKYEGTDDLHTTEKSFFVKAANVFGAEKL